MNSGITDYCRYTRPSTVWNNIQKIGVVTNECLPYLGFTNKFKSVEINKCLLPKDKFITYKINDYTEIEDDKLKAMLLIKSQGPVQAEINTFEDFYLRNKSVRERFPIYEYRFGMFKKKLSIKLIGWNMMKKSDPYWIAMVPIGSMIEKKLQISFNESDFDSYFIYSDIIINNPLN